MPAVFAGNPRAAPGAIRHQIRLVRALGPEVTDCKDGCDPQGLGCLTCAGAQHACFGECFDNTDIRYCGKLCQPCRDFGALGSSTCDGTKCQVTCAKAAITCANEYSVVCRAVDIGFEDQIDGVTVAGINSTRAHTGQYSLSIDGSSYSLSLCPTGEADLAGKTVEIWVYAELADGALGGPIECSLVWGRDAAAPKTEIPLGQWALVSRAGPATPSLASTVNISCYPSNTAASVELRYLLDDIAIR
jgi:hypothetical protein